MTDFDEKWKEYRNRAIQALGTAIVITLIVVANIGLIACIGRLSAQQTKYLLYTQFCLVDIFGCVCLIHCYFYFDKFKNKKKNGNETNKRRQGYCCNSVCMENRRKQVGGLLYGR